MKKDGICGLWVDDKLKLHLAYRDHTETLDFKPFAWFRQADVAYGEMEQLNGQGALNYIAEFSNLNDYKQALKISNNEIVRGFENQFLLKNNLRLFSGMFFNQLKRCQLDIETACSEPSGFSNANNKNDRVLAIGLKMGDHHKNIVLSEDSDDAEIALLKDLEKTLKAWDPDIIEGHNIFKFDLDYLRIRCKKYKLKCNWGRFDAEASFRNSRYKVAERWVDFPRCDIPGRTVFDTYLIIQQYDVTKRELESYGLKSVAIALGITDEDTDDRTYLEGHEIQISFKEDRNTFLSYLEDDLRETEGLANFLLPTYFAQTKTFPLTLQEITLRGSGTKVDLVFLEKYYQAKQALPPQNEGRPFAGGYTKSFETGIFKNILHFDVASLYPSLLLSLNKNPKGDTLGCFIPMLKELRQYRLEYKQKAREATDKNLKIEYEARQNAFKILINSFYGYLGFDGARFGDSELAAELTQKGRDLLLAIIQKFEDLGCNILEADTDGIYVCTDKYFESPNDLLKIVSSIMPHGVSLEYDGKFEAMFSYKAKNYALREGDHIIIRGSALRSRGIEPFLRDLTQTLIKEKLGFKNFNIANTINHYREAITNGTCDIYKLGKSERLSQNPESYAKDITASKKPRRASLEVALTLNPIPKMGDKITYFITNGPKARMPDWQLARPIQNFDKHSQPYNINYYLKKLENWIDSFEFFFNKN